jgi:hypothetical protein
MLGITIAAVIFVAASQCQENSCFDFVSQFYVLIFDGQIRAVAVLQQ